MGQISTHRFLGTGGTPIGKLPVGASVFLNENGVAEEYLVVHQGLPSSLYDASCNGTWILKKEPLGVDGWRTSYNSYADSGIHSYLNSSFIQSLDAKVQSIVKQVKIPYGAGGGNSTVYSGANGLETKAFLLSGYEVGFVNENYNYLPMDGSRLSYFTDDASRKLYQGAAPLRWWLRSPRTNNESFGFTVLGNGEIGFASVSDNYYIRPELILPQTVKVSKDFIITG